MAFVLATVAACAAERDRAPQPRRGSMTRARVRARCATCHATDAPAAGYATIAISARSAPERYSRERDRRRRELPPRGRARRRRDATTGVLRSLPTVRAWIVDDELAYPVPLPRRRAYSIRPAATSTAGRSRRAGGTWLCARAATAATTAAECRRVVQRWPHARPDGVRHVPRGAADDRRARRSLRSRRLRDLSVRAARWTIRAPDHERRRRHRAGGRRDDRPGGADDRSRGSRGPARVHRGTCANVYCHGACSGRGRRDDAPTWVRRPVPATCGSCHGDPPPAHASNECAPVTHRRSPPRRRDDLGHVFPDAALPRQRDVGGAAVRLSPETR